MFVRADGFGVAHKPDFAPSSLGSQLFSTLATIIAEIDGHAASETSARGSARQGTSTRSQARDELRADLEVIRRTARAMSDEVPGIDDKFRLPRDNNDSSLLSAARAALQDAPAYSAQFIAHEVPADFIDDLRADIAALEESISSQGSGVGDHVSASAAIDDAIRRGVEVVRKLDAIIRNKYANNPSVLAEWTSASHTERAPKHKKSALPTSPPTT
jgi:hypothetical protein